MAEGIALRAITRLTGISRTTLQKLLEDAGQAFSDYQDRMLVNLSCKRIQVDEAWSFCYAKQKNVATAKAAPANAGDIWTWVGLDADTKLVASFFVGGRDGDAAIDVHGRFGEAPRQSRATDERRTPRLFGGRRGRVWRRRGLCAASEAVWPYLRGRQGPVQPRRMHGHQKDSRSKASRTRSISAVLFERQNLNIRMGNRRLTRLTNAFSKRPKTMRI